MSNFVHLHCHSDVSIYDGFQTVPGMVEKAYQLGYRAIALTDHGKLGGLVKLSENCRKKSMKPIFGLEAYCEDSLTSKDSKRYHLTLLAKNNIGLKNLYKLATISSENTHRGFPRIDLEILKQNHEGLIVFSGCAASKFSRLIVDQKLEEAEALACDFKSVWGEDFYIEVMWNGYEPQKIIFREGVRIADKHGIKVIVTNDAHYSEEKDGESQRIKIAISRNGPLKYDEYRTHHMYLKSYQEMQEVFSGARTQYLHNTIEIVDKCDAEIVFGKAKMPVCEVPTNNEEFNRYFATQHPDTLRSEAYLTFLTENGLKQKGLWDKAGYRERIYKELETIKFTGFGDYFLIVEDYCRFARNTDITVGSITSKILVGCGRGSGVGSLALYCLGVTGIDPMKYNLQMDRFLYAEAKYLAPVSDFFESIEPGLSSEAKAIMDIQKASGDATGVEETICLPLNS